MQNIDITVQITFPYDNIRYKNDDIKCTYQYLDLPLSLGRLRRVDLQPCIDKAASRLEPWKIKYINREGCATLVKSVLLSMSIFS